MAVSPPLSLLDACRARVSPQDRALIDELLENLPTTTKWSDRRRWPGHGAGSEVEYNRRFELIGNVDRILDAALDQLIADSVRITGHDLAAPYHRVTVPTFILRDGDIDWRSNAVEFGPRRVVDLIAETVEQSSTPDSGTSPLQLAEPKKRKSKGANYGAEDDRIARELLDEWERKPEKGHREASTWELADQNQHLLPGKGNPDTKRKRLARAFNRQRFARSK